MYEVGLLTWGMLTIGAMWKGHSEPARIFSKRKLL
jgi:hypothetical protein